MVQGVGSWAMGPPGAGCGVMLCGAIQGRVWGCAA